MLTELDLLDLFPSHLVAIPEWESEAEEAIIHGGDRSAPAPTIPSWPRSRRSGRSSSTAVPSMPPGTMPAW